MLTWASQFKVIQTNLAVIRQGRRGGIKAWAVKPTFTVGKATWRHSVVWYAGAIAHDAYHAKLYIDAKGGETMGKNLTMTRGRARKPRRTVSPFSVECS